MVTVMASEPGKLPLSVTEAVMVWVPTVRAVVENEPPVPMLPSMSEFQDRLAVMLPSSVSLAAPTKVMFIPTTNVEASVGAVMDTVGAVLAAFTVTVMASDAAKLPLSVTEAVMTWVPTVRVLIENEPVLPMLPSMSEFQDRFAVMSPSSKSLAVPTKVMLVPSMTLDELAGAVMDTVGAAFTVTVMASDPAKLPLSVTEAVMVWVPTVRVLIENEPVLPMLPSMSEFQDKFAAMSPSSVSLAAPTKVMFIPTTNVEASVGAVMDTVGAVLAAFTVTVMASEPGKLPLSVTEAVMIWVPTVRVLIENEPVLPMLPSISEFQDRFAVMSPSSKSLAVPTKVMLVPSMTLDELAGAVMDTVGAAFTVTVMASDPAKLPLSVTEAVMVWVPTVRVLIENEPVLPMLPSMSELQDKFAAMSPSSVSLAEPTKAMLVPSMTLERLAGAVMDTVGAVFGSTITVMASEPGEPSLSVTEAVMVWVPTVREVVENEPPVPMLPLMSELQDRFAVMSPSSKSLAVPTKVMLVVSVTFEGLAGAVMDTVGAAFTVTVMASDAAKLPLSVTEAVMTWVPTVRVLIENEPVLPMLPSMSEFQDRFAVMSPSSKSLAVPTKVMLVPSMTLDELAGAVMDTVGAAFTVTVMASDPAKLPLSVTEAVMVWVPTVRVLIENEPVLPMLPSMSELQDKFAAMSPSSVSLAVPTKAMLVPSMTLEGLAGAVMDTVGAVFGSTITVMTSDPGELPLSVTEAVMVWVPTVRAVVENEPPVPMLPLMSELQDRFAVMSPSSKSLAVPTKVMLVVSVTFEGLAGAVMDTVGAAFTVTVMASDAAKLPLSVTEAVMTWVPTVRVLIENEPVLPMLPSISEFQDRFAVMSPSSKSLAVPTKVMLVVSVTFEGLAGAVMDTVGAVFTVTVMASDPAKLPLSVTEAVMVWVPTVRVLIENEPVLPMLPSMSELQDKFAAMSPSSVSLAEPTKAMLVPSMTLERLAGAVMDTVGAVFGSTITVMASEPGEPSLSVTEAVMVWVPTVREVVENEPPVPMIPSMSELQDRFAVMSPSLISLAVPERAIFVVSVTFEGLAGEMMDTVGERFPTT